MKEIEIKIIDVDRKEVEDKLKKLGAKKKFEGNLEAQFLESEKHGNRRAEFILRLRKEGDRSILTLKRFIESKETKVCEEYEVEVSDFKTTKEILKQLGFTTYKTTHKRRISYELNGTKFEFDKYSGDLSYIPEFLEIEGKDKDTVLKSAKMLGFQKEECRSWSTLNLIKHYRPK